MPEASKTSALALPSAPARSAPMPSSTFFSERSSFPPGAPPLSTGPATTGLPGW